MTRGSFCTLSISPSAMTCPSCNTVTRRAIDRTKDISCSTTHDRVLARQRQQELGRALDLVRRHAGNRLVNQEQLRVLHQQHADFEPLLLAVRKYSSRRPALPREADDVKDLVDSLLLRGRNTGSQRFQERPAAGQCQFEVLEYRQLLEHGRLLKLPPDSGCHDFRLGQLEQINAVAK